MPHSPLGALGAPAADGCGRPPGAAAVSAKLCADLKGGPAEAAAAAATSPATAETSAATAILWEEELSSDQGLCLLDLQVRYFRYMLLLALLLLLLLPVLLMLLLPVMVLLLLPLLLLQSASVRMRY